MVDGVTKLIMLEEKLSRGEALVAGEDYEPKNGGFNDQEMGKITKIQAMQRGKKGRQQAKARKAELVEDEKQIVKIQAVQRGKQGRYRTNSTPYPHMFILYSTLLKTSLLHHIFVFSPWF